MHGEIHHFSASGQFVDEDGDDLVGYYYRFVDANDQPVTGLIGPYNSGSEAELACQLEFNSWLQ